MLTAAIIASVLLLVLVLCERAGTRARAFTIVPPLAGARHGGSAPVTVLLPARNERDAIADAIRSVRAQTRKPQRLIVVDDGSTDGTAERATAALESFPGGVVRRVDGVPEGWTGKTHALECGRREADTEWVLTIDADVTLAPDALSRAFATVEAERLDALSLSPTQDAPGGAVRALQEAAYALLDRLYPFTATARPDTHETAASGAFFLVRRGALDVIGGFGAVRGDLIEDLALAQRLTREGRRVSFRPAQGLVRVRMYRTLGDALGGWRRLLAPLVASSLRSRGIVAETVRAFVTAAALPCVACVAAWAAFGAPLPAALLTALLACTVMVLGGAAATVRWIVGRSLLGAALVASARAHRSRAGIQWKGRAYAAHTP